MKSKLDVQTISRYKCLWQNCLTAHKKYRDRFLWPITPGEEHLRLVHVAEEAKALKIWTEAVNEDSPFRPEAYLFGVNCYEQSVGTVCSFIRAHEKPFWVDQVILNSGIGSLVPMYDLFPANLLRFAYFYQHALSESESERITEVLAGWLAAKYRFPINQVWDNSFTVGDFASDVLCSLFRIGPPFVQEKHFRWPEGVSVEYSPDPSATNASETFKSAVDMDTRCLPYMIAVEADSAKVAFDTSIKMSTLLYANMWFWCDNFAASTARTLSRQFRKSTLDSETYSQADGIEIEDATDAIDPIETFHTLEEARGIISEHFPQLTQQEQKIVILRSMGMTQQEIAKNLSISFETVNTQLDRAHKRARGEMPPSRAYRQAHKHLYKKRRAQMS